MKKIGIMGGTFNPIHYGHLILAEQARDGVNLDQVIFIPAKMSPFKINQITASEQHRYTMVKLAIEKNKRFTLSDIELKGPEISYTVQTLKACRDLFNEDVKIYFICGTDSFLSMESWREAKTIFNNFSLIVGSRPRYRDKARDIMIKHLESTYHTEIQKIHMPKIDISSTEIKKRIREDRSIKYLVPSCVEEYIYGNNLYRKLV